MNDNEFWVSIWKVIAVTFIAVIVSGVTSCQMTNSRITEMVKAGADPIDAMCAVSSESTQICTIVVSKRN